MDDERYTTYEAKARFSELLKKVREGRTITVTYHGEPVAEIRPLEKHSGTAARIEWLRSRGVISAPGKLIGRLESGPARPGALERFLAERD
ncbi:MAG: type II toxin-antitoxin system prevent-host-death family antitoxin [Gemmatimonadetes bacterium]|nr:type II toxin-antitoxin system prevent-host-death family antitoxin [Gemmatimonadota bacterium]